jgi:phospholipid/cholesterol/gamma-HCH transport system substrate-binding protein
MRARQRRKIPTNILPGAAMTLSIETRARLLFAAIVLAGIAAACGWYFVDASQRARYQLRTTDTVSGLLVDAPVEFHGIEIGSVKKITLADAHTVNILIEVRKDAPINSSTIATITARGVATRGFTGYVYIALENEGNDGTPLLAAAGDVYPLIHTAPSRSINLDTAISQVNQNVQTLTDLLNAALDKQTLNSFKQAVNNLQKITGALEANNEKLNALISNAAEASNKLEPMLQSGNDTLHILQQQVLPETYRALDNVNRLSTSLNNFSDKLNRDPSIIVRGTAAQAPGPGEKK